MPPSLGVSRLPSHTPSCSRWESWEHRSPPGPSPGERCPPRHEGRVSAPPAGSCRAALTASDPSPACGGTRPGHRPTEGGRAEQSFWLSADHTNPRLRDRPRKGCRPWNVRPRASAAPAALTLRGSRQGSCAEGRPPHHFGRLLAEIMCMQSHLHIFRPQRVWTCPPLGWQGMTLPGSGGTFQHLWDQLCGLAWDC